MRSTRTPQRAFRLGSLATLGLMACLPLALACGGDDGDEATAGADKGRAKIEIPMPEAEAEEPGVAEVAEGSLPAGYPEDLPTFPGAETKTSMVIPGGTGMVIFSAEQPVEAVTAFFKKALPEQGWNVEGASEDGTRIHAKKDNRTATVSIEGTAGHTEIAIVLGGA